MIFGDFRTFIKSSESLTLALTCSDNAQNEYTSLEPPLSRSHANENELEAPGRRAFGNFARSQNRSFREMCKTKYVFQIPQVSFSLWHA